MRAEGKAYRPADLDRLGEGVVERGDELAARQDGHLGCDRASAGLVFESHRANLGRRWSEEDDACCLDRGSEVLSDGTAG